MSLALLAPRAAARSIDPVLARPGAALAPLAPLSPEAKTPLCTATPLDRGLCECAAMAARQCHAAHASIGVIEGGTFYLKGRNRPPSPAEPMRFKPAANAFCDLVIRTAKPLASGDPAADAAIRSRVPKGARAPGAYLGVPVFDAAGRAVAALCVIDPEPRVWTPECYAALERLADCVAAHATGLAVSDVERENARILFG